MNLENNFEILKIKRCPSEILLFSIIVLISISIWTLLAISVIGLLYGLLIGFIIMTGRLAFIAHLRGNAVRITENQFPLLYNEIERISKTFAFKKIPEAYLMQGEGILNALATKFLRSKMLIIYSNLLEACGDNDSARSMIIGHELGHIKAGHLRWSWLIFPARFIPFLSNALSRAREYTCDRYGYACAKNKKNAINGLLILAAGPKFSNEISTREFIHQINHLNKGLMRIGEWLSSHPVIAKRIYKLDPALSNGVKVRSLKGTLSGLFIIFSFFCLVFLVSAISIQFILGKTLFGKGLENGFKDGFYRTKAIREITNAEKFNNKLLAQKAITDINEAINSNPSSFYLDQDKKILAEAEDVYNRLNYSLKIPQIPTGTDNKKSVKKFLDSTIFRGL